LKDIPLSDQQDGLNLNLQFYTEKLKSFNELCFQDDFQQLIESGLPGYLYCLISLQSQVSDKCNLKEYIQNIINQLYSDGLQKSDVLAWKWDDMINLGQHGICGILYIMIKSI